MASLEEYVNKYYLCNGSFKQLGCVNVKYRKRNRVYINTPVYIYMSEVNQLEKVPKFAELAIKRFFDGEHYSVTEFSHVDSSFTSSNVDKTLIYEEAVEYLNWNKAICRLLGGSLGRMERALVVKSNYPSGYQFHLKINRQ